MPNLRPFRDYDEHDVINLFALSGTLPVQKGTFVLINSGFIDTDTAFLGNVGYTAANTVSQRFGVRPTVRVTNSGEAPLGMLLYDVREVDENGEKLIFNPRKAAEMQCVLSGQAVPIVTKGIFLYSGVAGTPTVNTLLYTENGGSLSTIASGTAVAKALGPKDANGCVLIKLDL